MASSQESNNIPAPVENLSKDPERLRFTLELEFVQLLANPTYIHYLAQNRYFEDQAFIGYLKYLQYWRRPEYLKFIMYPHCLYFLELLQDANFRNAMAHPGYKELVHREQLFFWKNYRNNRLNNMLSSHPTELVAAPSASVPAPPSLPPTTTVVSAAHEPVATPPAFVPAPPPLPPTTSALSLAPEPVAAPPAFVPSPPPLPPTTTIVFAAPEPIVEPAAASPASVPVLPPLPPTNTAVSAAPEHVAAPQASVPASPPLPPTTTTVSVAPEPMQYSNPSEAALSTNDTRNRSVDRRKRTREV